MESFKNRYLIEADPFADVPSSYTQNELGKKLASVVFQEKPKNVVEFGVLNGYSTLWMGKAIQALDNRGRVQGYDLWDDYEHKHGEFTEVAQRIIDNDLCDWVYLGKVDIFEWAQHPQPFDLLHVDISNDGEKLEKLYHMLKGRPQTKGALMVFEGGTPERDEVEWMKKWNKKPICSTNIPYIVIDERFPGLSVVRL
jgi:predicted O-methyltransferase YrrM